MPLTHEQHALFTQWYTEALACAQDLQAVTIVDKMLNLLASTNESYEAEIHSSQMGVHPANRAGKRMMKSEMHRKGGKIVVAGFSWRRCGPDKAIAFGRAPGETDIVRHTEWITAQPGFGSYSGANLLGGSTTDVTIATATTATITILLCHDY